MSFIDLKAVIGIGVLALLSMATFHSASAQGLPSGADTGGPPVNTSVFRSEHIVTVTAITEVFGRGQRVTSAIMEYDQALASGSVSAGDFTVADRTVIDAYVSDTPGPDAEPADGHYVILTLDPMDDAAVVFEPGADRAVELLVTQAVPLTAASGASLTAPDSPVINTRIKNLIVDDFRQLTWTDPETGLKLRYNLFAPEGAEAGKPLPLVLFMHDYGVTGANPLRTLVQGLGAVSFASPEDQAKHPAFVLAPQYPVGLANDAHQLSGYVEATVRLLEHLQSQYAIDPDRLYVTGQSGGCMAAIALNIAHPDLFAASLFVAGQWPADNVEVLADRPIWAIVSEDDRKAYPGMGEIVDALEAGGATVARATWDAKADAETHAGEVQKFLSKNPDANVHFTAFSKGSVLPAGQESNPGAGHVYTWYYAYAIPSVRDWLFTQSK